MWYVGSLLVGVFDSCINLLTSRMLGVSPSPEQPHRQLHLILGNVPAARVQGSAFWYLLYRQMVYPSQVNGPGVLYGVVLPFANSRPLSANFGGEPDGWVFTDDNKKIFEVVPKNHSSNVIFVSVCERCTLNQSPLLSGPHVPQLER